MESQNSTSPSLEREDDSFYVPVSMADSVKANILKKDLDPDIVLTSNTVADEEKVKFSGLQSQDKNKSRFRRMSDNVLSSVFDCYDKEVEIVNCLLCSYSSVSAVEVKFHCFSQHPTKSACAFKSHGSEGDITFFCVKETCDFSTTVCDAYEKHLMNCLNINERLSDSLKERLRSSIEFVSDYHKRRGLLANLAFEDFVSCFKALHEFKDSCSTAFSHCMKSTHLVNHVSNPCASSVTQNLKWIKSENDSNCYDQVCKLEKEVEGDVTMEMNEPVLSTFSATIKRESMEADSSVDQLVSGNPHLENNVAGELSFNLNNDFFSKETQNDIVKSEETSNSEMDTTVVEKTSPLPWTTNGLNKSIGQTEVPHSCHLCDLGFSSRSLVENQKRLEGDCPFVKRMSGPHDSCQMFKEKGQLKDYMGTSIHDNSEISFKFKSCKECGKTFRETGALNVHMRIHKGEKPFKCKECGLTFRTSGARNSHVKIHTGERPFECNECGQTFRLKGTLINHMRIHSGEKPFTCGECGQTFRQNCTLNAHMRIHSGEKPYECKECGQTFSRKNNLGVHMRKHTGEKPFKCKECGHAFSVHCSLIDHMSIHSGEKPFKCEECGQTFRLNSTLKVHMRRHSGERPFKCKECGKAFTQSHALKVHMIIHTGERPYKCKECGQTFCQKGKLSVHMTIHRGGKPFECKECGQTFSLKGDLDVHMRMHTTIEKPFKCVECGKTFCRKYTLKKHMKTHSGEKPFMCMECGKTFYRKDIITEHMKIHTREKPFKCMECDKTFFRKYAINEHMKIHTGEKPFMCIECGKTFRRKERVTEHMRVHTGEKPFKCKECSKAFCRKNALHDHMKSHADEMPFKCMECGKTFHSKYRITEHMKIHTGERPFKCMECSKTYMDKSGLTKHMRIHTGERPFKCQECGQAFRESGTLNKHVKRIHSGEKH